MLARMCEESYVSILGKIPTGKLGTPRMHYEITEYGIVRLKEELIRLRHVVKTAENIGLLDDDTPLDIQKLILEASMASHSTPSQR